MSQDSQVPARVQWSTGFGYLFWGTLAILLLFGIFTFVAIQGSPLGFLARVLPVVMIVGILVVRFFQAPKVTFDFTAGVVHSRGKRIPFADITAISVREQYKAGDWLHLAVGSKLVSKLNISGTLFASPRLPQWQALREFMLMRMQLPIQQTQQLPREQLFQSETPMPATEALAIVEEHIAWLWADNVTRLGQQLPSHRLKFRHIVF